MVCRVDRLVGGWPAAQTLPTAARIESVPLELTMPERYQVTEVLEPIRQSHAGRALRTALHPHDRSPIGCGRSGFGRNRPARPHRSRGTAQDGRRPSFREKQALLKATRTTPTSTRPRSRPPRHGSSWPSSSSIAAPCAPRSRAADPALPVMHRSICAERNRHCRAGRRVEPQGIAAGRPPQCDGEFVALTRSDRGARGHGQGAGGPASARRACKSCASWPRPCGAAILVVANSKGELEPGLRVQRPGGPVHAASPRFPSGPSSQLMPSAGASA